LKNEKVGMGALTSPWKENSMPPKPHVSPARMISQGKGKDVNARPRYFSPKVEWKKRREAIEPRIRKD
jgi:hypothetical protein